jgi:hypothetical protein
MERPGVGADGQFWGDAPLFMVLLGTEAKIGVTQDRGLAVGQAWKIKQQGSGDCIGCGTSRGSFGTKIVRRGLEGLYRTGKGYCGVLECNTRGFLIQTLTLQADGLNGFSPTSDRSSGVATFCHFVQRQSSVGETGQG